MIEAKNLYYYLTKDFYALFDVSFSIEKGEKVVIFGEEDSGKTSLLRLILGLEKPTKGEILLNGTNPTQIDFKREMNALFLTSKGAFFENKSCYYNLEKVCKMRGEKPDFIRLNSFLQTFGLYSYKNTKAKNLNSYNRVMLQLARASLREKFDLIVIDDVFKDLAYAEIKNVVKHIKTLISSKNSTVIIATSNKDVVKQFGKRVINLKLGSINEEA